MPAPVLSTGTSLDAPIDLTSSDDEVTVHLRPSSRPNRAQSTAILPGAVPFSSNHGLILPGSFSSGSDGRESENKNMLVPLSTRILPPQPQFSRLYTNTNRKLKGPEVASTLGSPRSDSSNPAKRRKVDTTSSIPRIPRKASSTYALILSPQAIQPLRRESPIIPPPRPQRVTSEIPVQQEVQVKLQVDELDHWGTDSKNQVYDIATTKILKHVRNALEAYRQTLSRSQQDFVARHAAQELLSNITIFEHFEAESWKMEYEKELSKEAKATVKSSITFITNSLRVQSTMSEPDISSLGALAQGESGNAGHFGRMKSSEYSTEDEPVFEAPMTQEHSITSGLQRRYSSSPTTSFSIDLPDEPSLDSKRRSDTTTTEVTTDKHRSSRSKRQNAVLHGGMGASQARPAIQQSMTLPGYYSATVSSGSRPLRHVALNKIIAQRWYLSGTDRDYIRRGLEAQQNPAKFQELKASVLHIDFSEDEINFVCDVIRKGRGRPTNWTSSQQIISLMNGQKSNISKICNSIKNAAKKPGNRRDQKTRLLLQTRGDKSIRAFLEDAAAGHVPSNPQVVRIKSSRPRSSGLSSLLREREIWGMAPHRVGHCKQPFEVEFSSSLEDSLVPESEWTDCCGDITAISWTSNNAFVCGATAHSDYHNMQYNKPGNLLVGSAPLDTLKSIPGHRIVRPIVSKVENAENALDSMRQTQDPWLYTSVVSTAHSTTSGYTFTASFDRTVKIWKVSEDGSSMDFCGSWKHDGNVNFVVTSEHHERVATASDVSSSAIRVYNFDDGIGSSPYDTYDCDRALSQALEPGRVDKWAYFPATIAWGKSPGVKNLLLVGYSPRSLTSDETDIPDDKKNSGEICLWNVDNYSRVLISSAKTQNVFEVLWHPTQPIFLAATSPAGTYEPDVRTQIRLFAQNEFGTFMHIKALDCSAFDINELTIMPNSTVECYVTASCTDGNTYVWDTAQGDRPIHTLGHGNSLDNPNHDVPREIADTGVKFATWGRTADRFYTGSSDGRVKAWDIQAPRGQAFVRTVLAVSGGVSAGAFSTDFSKLLVGDATGKVHLLGIKDEELDDSSKPSGGCSSTSSRDVRRFATTSSALMRKAPKVITPHPQPAAPAGYKFESPAVIEQSAQEISKSYLEEGHLALLDDRRIGVVQGPNYAETMLYCYEAHEMSDTSMPLLPEWQARQQSEVQTKITKLVIPILPTIKSSNSAIHKKNMELDLDISQLSLSTREELNQDGVDFGLDHEHTFDFELSPRQKIFRRARDKRHAGSSRASFEGDEFGIVLPWAMYR